MPTIVNPHTLPASRRRQNVITPYRESVRPGDITAAVEIILTGSSSLSPALHSQLRQGTERRINVIAYPRTDSIKIVTDAPSGRRANLMNIAIPRDFEFNQFQRMIPRFADAIGETVKYIERKASHDIVVSPYGSLSSNGAPRELESARASAPAIANLFLKERPFDNDDPLMRTGNMIQAVRQSREDRANTLRLRADIDQYQQVGASINPYTIDAEVMQLDDQIFALEERLENLEADYRVQDGQPTPTSTPRNTG